MTKIVVLRPQGEGGGAGGGGAGHILKKTQLKLA